MCADLFVCIQFYVLIYLYAYNYLYAFNFMCRLICMHSIVCAEWFVCIQFHVHIDCICRMICVHSVLCAELFVCIQFYVQIDLNAISSNRNKASCLHDLVLSFFVPFPVLTCCAILIWRYGTPFEAMTDHIAFIYRPLAEIFRVFPQPGHRCTFLGIISLSPYH